MNKVQARKVIKVIEQDATGVGMLYDPETQKMCVLGGLLYASGVSKAVLRNFAVPAPSHKKRLEKHYGISRDQRFYLMDINDTYKRVTYRRKALIKQVKEWAGL